MSEIELRQDRLPAYQVSAIPEAARALVEWANSAQAAYELAQRLITTSFAPAQYKGKADEAAAAMLAGAEVGLSPMASLRSFDVIQGVAAPRALALRAIVQSLGHQIVIDEQTPMRVTGRGKRKGTNEWQHSEWTIERANKLGVTGKDNWKKQPQAMLVARVTSELARLIAADAILGIPYSAEELTDEQPEPTTRIARQETKPKTTTVRRQQPAPAEPPEPEFDQAEPTTPEKPSDPSETITAPQQKMLHALFRDKGFFDRDDALSYAGQVLDRDIATTKDLTKADASKVIDALGMLADTDTP